MYSVTRSFGLNGLSGFAVAVEADISGGLPAFSIVGLPDSAVRESADRVRAAIKNLGFKFPDRRITINLAPADVRKTGPVYDLPLLLAVLTASGQLEDVPADAAFLGELALDGTLRPVSGVLPMALAAAENGTHALYVPAENAAEAAEACADSMAVYPAHTAREVVDALRGISPLAPAAVVPFDPADAWAQVPDFADVMGQSLARRAMVIAAAGGHNVLLIWRTRHRQIHAGPPPARHPAAPDPGRSRGDDENLFHCRADARRPGPRDGTAFSAAPTTRPVRLRWRAAGRSSAPASAVWPTAASSSSTNCPSSPARASKCCASPSRTAASRSAGPPASATYPSRFQLVAAMNPCKCGYYGHPTRACTCSPSAVRQYRSRVSGPLLDRIDLQVEVTPVAIGEISQVRPSEPSAAIRERVIRAREVQAERFREVPGVHTNAMMNARMLREFCPLDQVARELLDGRWCGSIFRPCLRPDREGGPHDRRSGGDGRHRCGASGRGDRTTGSLDRGSWGR